MRIHLPAVDLFSFLLGAALASIFWLIISALKPIFRQLSESRRVRQIERKSKAHDNSRLENQYRQYVLRVSQGLHLAAPLFSLDEIVLEPRLLLPPAQIEPGGTSGTDDIVTQSIPFMPDFPELGCLYDAPTISMDEALSVNSDIVLLGHPGSGKTVSLAWLASRLARKEQMTSLPSTCLPVWVHAADLGLPLDDQEEKDPLDKVTRRISDIESSLDTQRIHGLIKNAFLEKRAVLMLDGMDELPPATANELVRFITSIKRLYPGNRIIITADPNYTGNLTNLQFVPFALAAWNMDRATLFYEKWGRFWDRFVKVESWTQSSVVPVEPILLNRWLLTDQSLLTPLELTLRAWAAYAGDTRGGTLLDAIESHVSRLTPDGAALQAIEMLAMQQVLEATPFFDHRKGKGWIKTFEAPEQVFNTEISNPTARNNKMGKPETQINSSPGIISKLIQSTLLCQHRSNILRFTHPVIYGYLSGRILSNYNPKILVEQPDWIGKFLAMQYLTARAEETSILDEILSSRDRPLEKKLLLASRWLRNAPRNCSWKGTLMGTLADLLQQEGHPLTLRAKALTALLISGDPSISALFRQLIQVPSPELLQLAILGIGAIRDTKVVDDLSPLLNHASPNIGRATCLALTKIGTRAALDAVATALLHGEETLRRSAAEALSSHAEDGHAILKEGTQVNDILVRRAVTYGLGRIKESWAGELLSHIQLEDKEWIVRAAATDAIDYANHSKLSLPHRMPPPSESPWLIAYAGKLGIGIAPDKTPVDLLLRVLKDGDDEERHAAISYLCRTPNSVVFSEFYKTMYSDEPSIRDAVFSALSEIHARGIEIPDPVQFGVL